MDLFLEMKRLFTTLACNFSLSWIINKKYQESHVPKKKFDAKSYLERKNLEGSQQKSTFLQIYIVRL